MIRLPFDVDTSRHCPGGEREGEVTPARLAGGLSIEGTVVEEQTNPRETSELQPTALAPRSLLERRERGARDTSSQEECWRSSCMQYMDQVPAHKALTFWSGETGKACTNG